MRFAGAALLYSFVVNASLPPRPAVAADAGIPTAITVIVDQDPGGIEKGLTGPHVLKMSVAARSKPGQDEITVGCVPCFSVFLSFAFARGRLYAMNGQTDNRRDRYIALVNGQPLTVEAMSGLRGRDWLDAFRAVDLVPGCARELARGKDMDTVARRGTCISQ
jgi:hypothetical protein